MAEVFRLVREHILDELKYIKKFFKIRIRAQPEVQKRLAGFVGEEDAIETNKGMVSTVSSKNITTATMESVVDQELKELYDKCTNSDEKGVKLANC